MTVYMAVTNDKYEYPVFICDTMTELAKCVGKKIDLVSHLFKNHANGIKPRNFTNKDRGYKYIKVDIDYDPTTDIIDNIDGNGDWRPKYDN